MPQQRAGGGPGPQAGTSPDGDGSSGVRTLLLPPHIGIDLIAAFYGCLYAGCVPITVRPPHPQNIATTLPTVKMIVEVTLPAGAGPSSSWGRGRGAASSGRSGSRISARV